MLAFDAITHFIIYCICCKYLFFCTENYIFHLCLHVCACKAINLIIVFGVLILQDNLALHSFT